VAAKFSQKEAVLLDAIPTPTIITTPDGEIVYLNPVALNTFGYKSRKEFVKANAVSYWVDPADREEFVRLVRSGGVRGFEVRLRRKDGTVLWASANASIKKLQNRNLIFASYTDITNQKSAENSARQSEESYKVLFDDSQLAIWLVNTETKKIEGFNTMAHESLGYTREEFEQLDISQIDPHMSQKAAAGHSKRLDQNQNTLFETKHLSKGGEILNILGNLKRVHIKGKVMTQVVCHDITLLKEMEKALRDSEEHYRFLAENIDDIVWVADLEMNLSYISPSIEKLTGYTVGEFMAMKPEEWIFPSSLVVARDAVQKARDEFEHAPENDVVNKYELEMYCKDGSTVWLEVIGRFIMDENGIPTGRIGCSRSITEQKKMMAELENYRAHLEKLVKTRTVELEEVNTTLRVLLEEINQEKSKLKGEMLFNIRQMVLPYIKKLKKTELAKKQKNFIDIIESNLTDIVLPIAHNMPLREVGFSGTEIQVTNFIIQGQATRQIAEQLSLSIKTIEFHRNNIRKKLGIKHKKINLRTFLSSYKA